VLSLDGYFSTGCSMLLESRWGLGLLAVAFLSTLFGTQAFHSFAIRNGIVANPNFRSLHERPMPRGGGIVFALVFLCAFVGLWFADAIDKDLVEAIGLGGLVATGSGFVDDCAKIRAATKFAIQALLAAWVMFCFGGKPLVDLASIPTVVELALSWLALVWLMNLYNFMDGIDGMAACGAVFICAASIVALLLASRDVSLMLVFGLLGVCCFGFLLFNWPPASIFMGDSGSLFLGYCFGALIVKTITAGQIGLWTWLIIFGYFAGDTTTTTLVRIFVTRSWYREHRSHAYQNLARIWGSHRNITLGVTFYHLLWILPLAAWSTIDQRNAPFAAALALTPVILWTLRFGPRLSSS
jgi:glycosyltransferase WbpL